MRGFFQAIDDYSEAIQLVSKLRLGIYFVLPALISICIGAGIIMLTIAVGDNIGNWLGSLYPFEFGAKWAIRISQWLGYILLGIIALFSFRYIIIILLAPFLSPLSQKVERYLDEGRADTGWSVGQLFREIQRSLRINVRNIFRELMWTIFFFILHWIPVIGWFSSLFILGIQAYYSGFGNMDFTLERHLNYRQSIQFVRANRGLATGNGIVFILMLMVPIVGLLVGPPLAVIAATIGTVRKLKSDIIPSYSH